MKNRAVLLPCLIVVTLLLTACGQSATNRSAKSSSSVRTSVKAKRNKNRNSSSKSSHKGLQSASSAAGKSASSQSASISSTSSSSQNSASTVQSSRPASESSSAATKLSPAQLNAWAWKHFVAQFGDVNLNDYSFSQSVDANGLLQVYIGPKKPSTYESTAWFRVTQNVQLEEMSSARSGWYVVATQFMQ